MSWQFEPVGIIHSCFAEKFAIPRQPLLAPAATATLELLPPYDQPEALEGLEGVSHLWLLFVFHAAGHGSKHLRVRPPRLGGNQRIGVFASRATHRPNPIGQSVVRLDGIVDGRLQLSGVDLLDGTPVLDIKPYVPYADAVEGAVNPLAPTPPAPIAVHWQTEALQQAQAEQQRLEQPLVTLVEQCLAQDPKPAYQQPDASREYGVRFWDVNVRWHYPAPNQICVLGVSRA
ncbi:tRNA (N6-threonylcarbamoyladenosine(37)-N6)-methyltransferase TrmO [Halopseudomonas maritima]|uniref:tRNA (N6-threonylcarbamoyladenosine(37)-N6)-methyltransferase TrmO n=1 Tax=Halopseudomonas maritima TaxID=2918528 RepID=UPI001EE9B414|nr:tRNA (N6-threonylcarbamoyladenosine(37)-N6)-methyltransferase TrmO [Halopseudomonas maritima]UJJ33214.1 tRNA (N6-threonylcarbamoyladenosine(37)-N6)-methyltransferase TrmO [Halopseudomonas maritima]